MACWVGLAFCFAAAFNCAVFHMAQLYVFESPPFFPEGTQVTRTDDRGFHAGGAATDTAYIPPEASEEFAQKLREDGFKETPLSNSVQRQLQGATEAQVAAQVANVAIEIQQCKNVTYINDYKLLARRTLTRACWVEAPRT